MTWQDWFYIAVLIASMMVVAGLTAAELLG
jgi:hypothetical protein